MIDYYLRTTKKSYSLNVSTIIKLFLIDAVRKLFNATKFFLMIAVSTRNQIDCILFKNMSIKSFAMISVFKTLVLLFLVYEKFV